jgi:hypothetical protein
MQIWTQYRRYRRTSSSGNPQCFHDTSRDSVCTLAVVRVISIDSLVRNNIHTWPTWYNPGINTPHVCTHAHVSAYYGHHQVHAAFTITHTSICCTSLPLRRADPPSKSPTDSLRLSTWSETKRFTHALYVYYIDTSLHWPVFTFWERVVQGTCLRSALVLHMV